VKDVITGDPVSPAGVENNFSSSSKHLKEDMDRLFGK
jgi:hypothetical protein